MATTRTKTADTYYVARAKGTRIRHKDEGAIIDVCWSFWHGMGGYSQEAWTDSSSGVSFNNAANAQYIVDHYRDSAAEGYDFKLIPGTTKVVKVTVETITYTSEEEVEQTARSPIFSINFFDKQEDGSFVADVAELAHRLGSGQTLFPLKIASTDEPIAEFYVNNVLINPDDDRDVILWELSSFTSDRKLIVLND